MTQPRTDCLIALLRLTLADAVKDVPPPRASMPAPLLGPTRAIWTSTSNALLKQHAVGQGGKAGAEVNPPSADREPGQRLSGKGNAEDVSEAAGCCSTSPLVRGTVGDVRSSPPPRRALLKAWARSRNSLSVAGERAKTPPTCGRCGYSVCAGLCSAMAPWGPGHLGGSGPSCGSDRPAMAKDPADSVAIAPEHVASGMGRWHRP